jgi:very-short-patch-repair endonuclease
MRELEQRSRAFAKALRRTLTKAEASLWGCLKGKKLNGYHFRRQHPIGPFIADFACVEAKLVLEVDGGTHMSDAGQSYDAKRTAFLEAQGWHVMRVWNNQVLENRAGVLRAIEEVVTARAMSKLPSLVDGGVGEADGGGKLA